MESSLDGCVEALEEVKKENKELKEIIEKLESEIHDFYNSEI